MDDAKQQLVDKLKTANNILVTVSRDPTVDQLASCLGLALLLNKQGKHTAAVFSGKVPSTIEFLKPEDTLEKNTDSLRDFIIALDKSKADKLRYKVEDNVVRIFITPYKTSLSEADLEFSQGDFNVDLVVALGVGRQEDLDEAIVAHGRILHDATVASVNIVPDGGLGSINWHDPQASSLSELVTDLAKSLDPALLDEQIATALLTGIVSATSRFSNDKTSSQTMSVSSTLMAAGANQQLVASKLEETDQPTPADGDEGDDQPTDDGTIEIKHDNNNEPHEDEAADSPAMELPIPDDSPPDDNPPPAVDPVQPAEPEPVSSVSAGPKLMTEPPSLGGTLTANTQPEGPDSLTNSVGLPSAEPPQLLERPSEPAADLTPPPPDWSAPTPPPPPPPAADDQPADKPLSLSDLEAEVKASEQQASGDATSAATGLNDVRNEVDRALSTASTTISSKPIEALNAQPMVDNLNSAPGAPPISTNPPAGPQVADPTAPPPVPPPIPFQFGNPNPPQQ